MKNPNPKQTVFCPICGSVDAYVVCSSGIVWCPDCKNESRPIICPRCGSTETEEDIDHDNYYECHCCELMFLPKKIDLHKHESRSLSELLESAESIHCAYCGGAMFDSDGSCVYCREKLNDLRCEKEALKMRCGNCILCHEGSKGTLMIGSESNLADSGNRTEFETGAIRDISEGKGRCDLLPLDVVAPMVNSKELESIEEFKRTKDTMHLYNAIDIFYQRSKGYTIDGLLELSKHFEAGAKKYSENNWKKGIPLHCYIDSGVRHYLKHLRGDTDEPHDRAFVWNILCAIWTMNHKPELDDI